jgi:hypothetical protein
MLMKLSPQPHYQTRQCCPQLNQVPPPTGHPLPMAGRPPSSSRMHQQATLPRSTSAHPPALFWRSDMSLNSARRKLYMLALAVTGARYPSVSRMVVSMWVRSWPTSLAMSKSTSFTPSSASRRIVMVTHVANTVGRIKGGEWRSGKNI